MNYIEEQCMPLQSFRDKIKEGFYGKTMTNIHEVTIYKNDKNQLRIKLIVANEDRSVEKKVNCLLVKDQEGDVHVNKKSFEYSSEPSQDLEKLNLNAIQTMMF